MSYRAWTFLIAVVAILIVGSLYFLQVGVPSRPTTYDDIGAELGSGRVEQPAAGFAITTPEGWLAWEPSHDFQDWWGASQVVRLWMEPRSEADDWWMADCGIADDCTREHMIAAGGEAYCWVIEDTATARDDGWTEVATPVDLSTAALTADGWTDVTGSTEALPNGAAGFVSATDPNGWRQSFISVSDGDRWLRLICGVLDSDVDPLTIASTLEFLPAAERS